MVNKQSSEYIKGLMSAKRIILKGDIDEALDYYEVNGEKLTWSFNFTMGYLDAISEYLDDCATAIKKEKDDIQELIDAIKIEIGDTEEENTNE